MTTPVRLPDPVAEDANREADERDISPGAVVEDWRDKARKHDEEHQ